MAEENKPQTGTTPEPQDQDVLFKLQVGITEFFLKNGRYFGYAAVVALVGAGVWGGWSSWKESRDEAEYARIAEIDYRMPKVEQMALYGLAPRDDLSDKTRMANVEEGARRYEAAAQQAHGAAAVLAWMRAAEAWDRAQKPDARLLALEQAAKVGAAGTAGFAADSAYAAALLDAGRVDDAQARYKAMAERYEDLYGAQALVSLARSLYDAKKLDEARATLADLKTRFPGQVGLGAEIEALLAAPGGA